MKVLVLGANGFIGGAVVAALAARGIDTVRGIRRRTGGEDDDASADVIVADFTATTDAPTWQQRLQGIDAVVNTIGVFSASAETFARVHEEAPIRLFEACAARGIVVVQLSALGATSEAETPFLRSKNRADEALLRLPIRGVVIQPSLVFGADGASSRLLLRIAALPVWLLPDRGDAVVQPVHVDDLAEAIVNALLLPTARGRVAAVGPKPLTLRDYLQCLRRQLRLRPARVASLPTNWLQRIGRLLGRHAGWIDPDALQMLARGNTADVAPFAALLGRQPRSCDRFITPSSSAVLRSRLRSEQAMTLLRLSLATLWILSGIVSLGLFPLADSLALLHAAGIPQTLAPAALYGAAAVDLCFGLLLLFAPRGRRAYRLQLMVIAFYTVVIAVTQFHFLLHPFAPIVKNLPVAAALWLLHVEEQRRWNT